MAGRRVHGGWARQIHGLRESHGAAREIQPQERAGQPLRVGSYEKAKGPQAHPCQALKPQLSLTIAHPRFREEMIRDLGHLLRPSFTFLWCHVTLPGLLALLTICILPLHHKETSYIAWNRSMSQEVKQPYPNSALGWVTFLSVFTFLPIPAYLLYQWGFLQDPMTSETVSFQTMTMDSSKPGRWLKHPVRKSTSSSQNKVQETSRFTQSPGRNPERPSFSLTPIASLFSLWSSSLITSKQVSPMFVAVDNNVKLGESTEEKMPNNSTD
ncbi:Hypothetical predicted protein [Marmota monax]|uniref:Uncharacterized protein n=1 Tax=Marmota monax TaxID=9995 RepID=A0A5E4BAI1_MARMO|nr:Hypothetical predicted protein [Marmota monax]